MMHRLKKKWNVSTGQAVVIVCVFAVTGFTTAYLSRVVTTWVGFTPFTPWYYKALLRLAVLTFGYQAILLSVAFLFGQFRFFWQFELRLLRQLGLIKKIIVAPAPKTAQTSAP